jgi:hypothetical protein
MNPDRYRFFQAPGELVAEWTTGDTHISRDAGRCELPGCDAAVPHAAGNEGRVRYCCREHRRAARALRRRARCGGAR